MLLAFLNKLTLIQRTLLCIAIACFTTVAFLSLPPMPVSVSTSVFKSETVAEKALKLANTIHQMQQQASSKSLQLGLHLTATGYAFLIRDTASDRENVWQNYQQQNVATTGVFDKNIRVSLSFSSQPQEDEEERLGRSQPLWFNFDDPLKNNDPQIIFLPDGELTPFTLALINTEQPSDSRQIEVTPNGQIAVAAVTIAPANVSAAAATTQAMSK